MNTDMKMDPRSEMIFRGMPCIQMMCSMSKFAHPSELSVSDVGIGIMSFDFMSTITRMALCPCASGRCVIMSTEMFSQFLVGMGMG